MEWLHSGEMCRQTGKFSKTKLQHPHSIKWHSQSIMSHFLFAYTYIQYYVSEVCYWAGCECMDKVCYLQLRRWGKTEKHSPQLRLNHGPIARMGLCEVMKLQRIVACWSWPEIVSLSINRVEWISQWKWQHMRMCVGAVSWRLAHSSKMHENSTHAYMPTTWCIFCYTLAIHFGCTSF